MLMHRRTSKNKRILLFAATLLLAGIFLVVVLGNKPGNQTVSGANPLADMALYVAPDSRAAKQAQAWRITQPEKAKSMDRLAALPVAHWVTDTQSLGGLAPYVAAAAQANKVPVLVSYFFPKRDCGLYSAGGAESESAYKAFIDAFAAAIGDARAIVILEPDAISNIKTVDSQGQPCLTDDGQQMYYSLMEYAVDSLKARPGAVVYIDAGNSKWITDTAEVARRLQRAGITKADGFSLNVSNFQTTTETIAYGEAISRSVDNKHFVVDTSRNGNGPYTNPHDPAYNWCNPPDRALGHYPTTSTGHNAVDAYLFIKRPGESDGADPEAGEWWADYAVGLVERWPQELQPR
jgi:endoglucanase